jgi:hypothetical protein
MIRTAHNLIISAVLLLLFDPCSQAQFHSSESSPKASSQGRLVSQSDQDSCLQTARKFLGPAAIVLKCGRLSDAIDLEVIAALRVSSLNDDKNGLPVSRLVIARQGTSQWKIELNVDANDAITNDMGFVGVNFIDDSHQFPYCRVDFTDRGAKWGARTGTQFTMVLFSMNRDGKLEDGDIGLGIGWNPAVRRFQEIDPNGRDFAPEVKSPRHIKATAKP